MGRTRLQPSENLNHGFFSQSIGVRRSHGGAKRSQMNQNLAQVFIWQLVNDDTESGSRLFSFGCSPAGFRAHLSASGEQQKKAKKALERNGQSRRNGETIPAGGIFSFSVSRRIKGGPSLFPVFFFCHFGRRTRRNGMIEPRSERALHGEAGGGRRFYKAGIVGKDCWKEAGRYWQLL
jgi:hypothetical protein